MFIPAGWLTFDRAGLYLLNCGLVQERLILGNSGRGVMATAWSWGFRLLAGGVENQPINFGGISRIREVPANAGETHH